MKILAFAATNNRQSINKQLVSHAADLIHSGLIEGAEVEIIDLNDYEMPIFSVDREQAEGIHELAHAFYNKIAHADALLVSFAEHNASYTAAYKNLYDWTSRIDMKVYQGKPSVLLATSPGPGGAANVLGTAKSSALYFGMEVKADLSVAKFFDKFDTKAGTLTDKEAGESLRAALVSLKSGKQ